MSHIDRLVDERIALNAFYHATYGRLPVGERVEHWGTNEVDEVADALRPAHVRRPRWGHFFMVKDLNCLPALDRGDPILDVYEVTPEKPEGPLNWGWLRSSTLRNIGPRKADEYVRNYWAGVPGPNPCLDEYLAEAVHVDRYVGNLGDILKEHKAAKRKRK